VTEGLRLESVAGTYCVCRLERGGDPGPRPEDAGLYSVTWTAEEISVVCTTDQAPEGAELEGPFAALRVAGALDFSITGVLSGLTTALAAGGVSVFAISTYDTDYLLVPEDRLGPAAERIREAGHEVLI
jgi:hypothetical protein